MQGTLKIEGYPREMFRFQRRNAYRVRPLLRSAPIACLRHPMIPDMQLNLRVLDVSIGGCALFLPEDVPMIEPGVLLNGVELELDADTRITTPLRLQHVTSLQHDAGGVRLGCEMVNVGKRAKDHKLSQDGINALIVERTQAGKKVVRLKGGDPLVFGRAGEELVAQRLEADSQAVGDTGTEPFHHHFGIGHKSKQTSPVVGTLQIEHHAARLH